MGKLRTRRKANREVRLAKRQQEEFLKKSREDAAIKAAKALPEAREIYGEAEKTLSWFGRTRRMNAGWCVEDMIVRNWLRDKPLLNYATNSSLRGVRDHLGTSMVHHPWLHLFEGMCQHHEMSGGKDREYPHMWLTSEEFARFRAISERQAEACGMPELLVVPESFRLFQDIFELSDDELYVLYWAKKRSDMPTSDVAAVSQMSRGDTFERANTGPLLGLSKEAYTTVCQGFLFASGMLEMPFSTIPNISTSFLPIFKIHKPTQEKIAELLFPQNISTDLELDMYPHLDDDTAKVTAIISANLKSREPGLNILLWGPPGGGKTEYVVAMCKKMGWRLVAIGDYNTKDDKEKTRAERIVSLRLAIKLYGRDPNTVLLFDEMEDLFKIDMQATFSKAFINRIFETTQAPILWTTNNLETMGGAARRRMVYNIHFKIPPFSTRKLIWDMYSKKRGLMLSSEAIAELASDYDIMPSAISNACKVAKMSGLDVGHIKEVIQSNDTLMRGGEKRRFGITVRKDTPYDLSWVNAEIDLHKLTKNLVECDPDFAMCLYGPAGTGKSEYARYIAKRRGIRVLFKRASDLESPYVGVTEKLIAQAFEEAAEEGWMLIIDEGDSFLEDRRNAVRSYEKSRVNEVLSQMETIKSPFVITTNLMQNLDPAAMRRFAFKTKFDYLAPEQAAAIFKAYFKVEPPRRILSNFYVTPGDIAAVWKKAKIMHIAEPEPLMQLVEAETNLKNVSKAIGFGTH